MPDDLESDGLLDGTTAVDVEDAPESNPSSLAQLESGEDGGVVAEDESVGHESSEAGAGGARESIEDGAMPAK